MSLLQINGADMPAPSSLSVRLEDVQPSLRRTLSGAACVSRKGVARSLTCQWSALEEAAVATLLTAADAACVTVTYPDPASGETREMTAVCGERSMGALRRSAKGLVWTQIRLVFHEA